MKIPDAYGLYINTIIGLVRITHLCLSIETANEVSKLNENIGVIAEIKSLGFILMGDINDKGLRINGR